MVTRDLVTETSTSLCVLTLLWLGQLFLFSAFSQTTDLSFSQSRYHTTGIVLHSWEIYCSAMEHVVLPSLSSSAASHLGEKTRERGERKAVWEGGRWDWEAQEPQETHNSLDANKTCGEVEVGKPFFYPQWAEAGDHLVPTYRFSFYMVSHSRWKYQLYQ